MNKIVNFDNAATSFPKPEQVKKSVMYAINNCGGNPGRGGHSLSMRSAELVYSSRTTIADFFDAKPENVIFCANCTHALNYAINGIIKDGMHVIISSLEHNSVVRPLVHLKKQNRISITVVHVSEDKDTTVETFRKAINDKTGLIICTISSNVTGRLLPVIEIGRICNEKNICFIADGAQACGHTQISLKKHGINILCTSGHKGLYGISGTGLLITDGKYPITPFVYGGTGSSSSKYEQPDFLPDALESGTVNLPGIISVKSGIEFIRNIGLSEINRYESELTSLFINGISDIPKIKIYRTKGADYLPVVSFNLESIPSEVLASRLSDNGFCLRAGFHCSALAHEFLGTKDGTVRFSPSVFNNRYEVKKLCETIKNTSNTIENQ